MATMCSEEQGECSIICDFCKFYRSERKLDDACVLGTCLRHLIVVDIDGGCEEFHCMNAKDD